MTMIREQVAARLRWHSFVWAIGLLNPFMILPQLWQIWSTWDVAAISLPFLYVLFFLQATFSLHCFFTRDKMLMWSNGGAAASTFLVILSVIYFKQALL